MKRLIIWFCIMMFTVLLVACNKSKLIEEDYSTMNIKFRTGEYYYKNWTEMIGTYQYDVIPDQETAIAVAVEIFKGMENNVNVENFVPQSVFYDKTDEIWIVSFGQENTEMVAGEDCSIAIQKKDGKVLRIWFGE